MLSGINRNSVSHNSGVKTTNFEFNQAEHKFSISYPGDFIYDCQFYSLERKTSLTLKNNSNAISQTNYSYDSFGRLDKLTDGDGNLIVDYDYHPLTRQLEKETNGDGTKVNYDYDAVGRLQQVILGEGTSALTYTYSYDSNGSVTLTDPNGGTTQQLRNAEGEIGQTIDPLGRSTSYSYDNDGNLSQINGELGYKASFTYDDEGNVLTQTDALNRTLEYTYQADSDRITRFRDARDNDLLYSYDNRGNLSRITYEDGTQDKYFYNDKGLMWKSVNRRGQEIRYNYNANNQLKKEIYEDGSTIEYGYDSDNTLVTNISNSDSGDSTRFDFNQAENKFTIEHNRVSLRNFLHDYVFDGLGRKSTVTIQDGTNTRTTNYSYDSLGRLDKLTDGDGNLIVDYDYHPLTGQLARETNGNGTYTTYTYDLAGQLKSLINSQANGTVNSRFDYDYDRLGRRTEMVTLDGSWKYGYDLTGQLTSAVFTSTNPDIESQNISYSYDAAGNRTKTVVNGVTENYSTNNLNQYQSAGTTTYHSAYTSLAHNLRSYFDTS